MRFYSNLKRRLTRFFRREDGTASVEFVLVFPIFMLFFGMTYENGMISIRHVMLERGVDMTVRDVRLGIVREPDSEKLRTEMKRRICVYAAIIPDCENQLQLEMIKRDLRNWSDIDMTVRCIDRGAVSQPKVNFTNVLNNELIFLRACALFDTVMPTSGIGYAISGKERGSDDTGLPYGLVATSAFVVEPFLR